MGLQKRTWGAIMRILWICNIMLPFIAEHLHKEVSNKEGWLTGLCNVILERQRENGIVLGIAFPVEQDMDSWQEEIPFMGERLKCFGFYEDMLHPECYDPALEGRLGKIAKDFGPDVVHCFGTEFGHTLAVTRAYPEKKRILIGIQGLCSVYANGYMANLPESVQRDVTFRDWLKKDSLIQQQQKFAVRGSREIEAVKNAGNITGRTAWDRHYVMEWNREARYFAMNETLRPQFYRGEWNEDKCVPYSIFLSQGDYPIKGLHYMLLALPRIREQFPEVKVFVAGNSLVEYSTLKDKIKLSGYGKYLRRLMKKYDLQQHVVFLGKLEGDKMKEQYLKSSLFVCCSSLENSPNSLGEAMLLGVPCVSADVGGIPSLFEHQKDGYLYRGFRSCKNSFDNMRDDNASEEKKLEDIVNALSDAVVFMWKNKAEKLNYSRNARLHAKKTHDREVNYSKMMEIYASIGKS